MQGLKPGAYFFRRDRGTPELLSEGEFRAESYYLGLEQELPADACVDIFFLADFKGILQRYGNRDHRAAQLEAGTIGGWIYLAAYARRLLEYSSSIAPVMGLADKEKITLLAKRESKFTKSGWSWRNPLENCKLQQDLASRFSPFWSPSFAIYRDLPRLLLRTTVEAKRRRFGRGLE